MVPDEPEARRCRKEKNNDKSPKSRCCKVDAVNVMVYPEEVV
jgi:hypothetical protein